MANILNTLKSLFVVTTPDDDPGLKLKAPSHSKKRSLKTRVKKRVYNIDLKMRTWRLAKAQAKDPYRPRRELLYALYEVAMEDDRLLTQVRTARFTVQLAGFIIEHNGKENEDLHDLLEKPWFNNYMQYCVDTELYGHSLIEFYVNTEDGLFDSIDLIPREHVRPEVKQVVINTTDINGLPYDKGALSKYLVEIGRPDDLGLLLPLSKQVIRKDYSVLDWSRRNERFGLPFVIAKTATRDEKEIAEKARMLENFGSNMWAILDDEDEIDLKEPTSQGYGHVSFKDLIKYIDEGIAMLINGQTSTSDEKAYVGSAEVHERILNAYTLARMRRIQYHINEVLFPFLIKRGYPLTDAEFKFIDLMEEDEETTPKQKPEPEPKKKS